MRLLLLCVVSIVFFAHTQAEEKYPIRNIPAKLLSGEAVVRERSIIFTIKKDNYAVAKYVTAITVFSKKDENAGAKVFWYDKYRKLDELEGTIYDANGNEVKTLEDEDIKDYPGYDDNTLHSDLRVKFTTLFHNEYPYTIEYIHEEIFSGSINWPSWYAQLSIYPVEHSSFTVVCPEKYNLRYWCNKDSVKPKVMIDDGTKTYHWEAHNLPKLDGNAIGNDPSDVTTIVHIAPITIQMDDYKGSMTSWKDFGLWDYSLFKDRASLPDDAVKQIQILIQDINDPKEKTKKLYEYMQSHTRYISIQLGIGGWQPFEASFVHSTGYGDCKALVNYMYALLRQANIVSFPVLIKSGAKEPPIVKEFPSNQFDHVILCVPLQNDSVWLECTSQTLPFNRLSDFTEDKDGLMVTPVGGVLVHTPTTHSVDNSRLRTISVEVTTSGTIYTSIVSEYFGNQQADLQLILSHKSPEEREKWFLESMQMPNISLSSLLFEGLENHSPIISLRAKASFIRYASLSGKRIFLNPNLLEKRIHVPANIEKRLAPIKFDYAYNDIDSIYYKLPVAYTIESAPKPLELKTSFGKYLSTTNILGDSAIVFVRNIQIDEKTIPAEQYTEYRNFWNDIVRSDRQQVVLKQKE